MKEPWRDKALSKPWKIKGWKPYIENDENNGEDEQKVDKDKVVITCPNKECQQKLAIPRIQTRLTITCPKCGTSFYYGAPQKEIQLGKELKNIGYIIGWGLIFAIPIGLVFGLISRAIYLIIFFPIIMGYGVGIGAKKGVQIAKLSFVSIVLISVVLSALTYASMLFVDYQFFNYEMKKEFDAWVKREEVGVELLKGTKLYEDIRREAISDSLVSQTGYNGFIGYLLWRLKVGDEVGPIGLYTSNLGFIGTIILWLMEMIIIGYVIGKRVRKKLS